MDNVPSSAILAIIAIVAACLLGAFIFTTVQSQKEAGNQAVSKAEEMNAALDEADLTQYDGVQVSGSQVKSAIKLLKSSKVSVVVINKGVTGYTAGSKVTNSDTGTGIYEYNYTIDTSGDFTANGGSITSITASAKPSEDMTKHMNNKSSKDYISASGKYIGSIERDGTTGAIDRVVFTYAG